MKALLCTESLNLDLVEIQVTGCWHKHTCVRGAISPPFIHVALCIFFFGGVQKMFYFLCFGIKQASLKGIHALFGVHMWVFFNTESLNERAIHFTNVRPFT